MERYDASSAYVIAPRTILVMSLLGKSPLFLLAFINDIISIDKYTVYLTSDN
uniref:Uncharacterized protein n=1 Tax=Vibrio genomosp. F6 TaxID=723172 RepID=A0A0H3ZM68_9VIBR|nr:hypothetical protein [Vibrio genomosp. F6]